MKLLLVVLVCINIILADTVDKKTKPNKDDKNDKPAICSKCICDSKTKIVNCDNKNLLQIFTKEEWIALNDTETSMDVIRFENNGITEVPAFPDLPIRVLILKQNNIQKIAKNAFRNLSMLEELDLSFNSLTSINLKPEIFEGKYDPDTYEPLKKLKTLYLGSNKLHSINQDLFEHFPALESLSLDSNAFQTIDQISTIAISSIANLKFLDLSYMELTALPEDIFHNPRSLEMLNLTGNLFKTIPAALGRAINLKYLSLDENPMNNLIETNSFPILSKLETLSISYMAPLKMIGRGALSGLSALTTLICTNNPHLSSIHPGALSRSNEQNKEREEWPSIKKLYLHNNNISVLDSNLIARWDQVEVIDIRLNPWYCDCQNQWLIDVLMPIIVEKTPQLSSQIVCDHPTEMLGIELAKIKNDNSKMRCDDYYGNRPEKDGAILVGILIGLLVGIPIAWAAIFAYKQGFFGLCGRRGPADYSRAFYKRAHLQDDLHI